MFIYKTYVLGGEADAKFSLGEIWNLLQAGPLPNNPSKFCRQMINCLRQTHKTMMHKEKHRDEKDVLVGEYTKVVCICRLLHFCTGWLIERYMEGTIFRLYETKKDDSTMAATNLLGNIINIRSFEDGNGRILRLISAHF